jgi:hypothetical protein
MDNNQIIMMIIISILAAYLSTMNLWVVKIQDARLHLNDIYMVLLMTAWMVVFSYLAMSGHMGISKILFIVAVLLVIVMIYAIRNQSFINDKQFLNGMIPHHSMAILMANKIKDKTDDPRIKKLANQIIQSQTKEIDLMNNILKTHEYHY